jgi:hypothetical protein
MRPAKPYQSKNGTPIGKVNVRPPAAGRNQIQVQEADQS